MAKILSAFSVLFWSSNPDEGNAECFEVAEFDSKHDAIDFFQAAEKSDLACRDIAYIEIDGVEDGELLAMGIQRLKKNSRFKKCADNSWQQEIAMQAGMQGGCQAYNDEMGW